MSAKDKTLQQKLDELNQLIEWFDQDDFSIEEALAQFKKADALAEDIEKQLESAKNEITTLKARFDKD